MVETKKNFWVGLLVLLSLGVLLLLAFWLGALGSWRGKVSYQLLYGFAGGVEVGTPVRVSGVKVGRVDQIEFALGQPSNDPNPVTLKITISLNPVSAPAVKEDSQFFVNMAGIIGERYIEISPGSQESPTLKPGSVVRGIDPPRIDQLLSQGYGVFGRIQDFLNQNEKTLKDLLTSVNTLLADTNRVLKKNDSQKFFSLVDNLNSLTSNLNRLATAIPEGRSQKFVDQLFEMVERAHEIDKPTLKKFLQEEGIRARIF